MRILLVTHYYADHRGGVEIIAGELARRLAGNDCSIIWAASGPKPEEVIGGVEYLPMRALNVTERLLGVPYPVWGPRSLARLSEAVRGCTLVHLHDSLYAGNLFTYLSARRRGTPVVVTQHIGLVPYRVRPLRWLMAAANRTVGRMVLSGAAQTVFYSRNAEDYFSRFVRFREPPRFVPNGVDRDRFHPLDASKRVAVRRELGWDDDRLRMLFVGRFVEKKGLAWMRVLAERFPQCQWLFAGWGPEDPRTWGLRNVQCLGSVDRPTIARYYQAADLLVLPSRGEGFPLVVQEAMSCGTPVLISDETARAVSGVEGAAFVSPLVERELCTAMADLVSQPERLASQRAVVAAFAAEHWDWRQCADRYAEIFREVAEPEAEAEGRKPSGLVSG